MEERLDGVTVFVTDLPDGSHRAVMTGELDFAAAADVLEWLVRISGSTVELDISGLTFLDARGLGALVEAGQRLENDGNRLAIMGARGMVRRIFELCDLTQLLQEG